MQLGLEGWQPVGLYAKVNEGMLEDWYRTCLKLTDISVTKAATMKTTDSIRVQNQNFVDGFLRRKGLITISELFIFILIGIALGLTSCSPVL